MKLVNKLFIARLPEMKNICSDQRSLQCGCQCECENVSVNVHVCTCACVCVFVYTSLVYECQCV